MTDLRIILLFALLAICSSIFLLFGTNIFTYVMNGALAFIAMIIIFTMSGFAE